MTIYRPWVEPLLALEVTTAVESIRSYHQATDRLLYELDGRAKEWAQRELRQGVKASPKDGVPRQADSLEDQILCRIGGPRKLRIDVDLAAAFALEARLLVRRASWIGRTGGPKGSEKEHKEIRASVDEAKAQRKIESDRLAAHFARSSYGRTYGDPAPERQEDLPW